ncbi:MAG TPA: hypothetical protein VFP95_07190 [Gammaproteobacteria bacterium]|nr:hypothetical protein [Gammaproteobacteria bacterium]
MANHIRFAGLPAPEREFKFHSSRRWRFDFAWPPEKVALEVQGGHWTNGRHVRGKGFAGDCEKFSTAAAMGWRILQVTSDQVNDGRALNWLMEALGVSMARQTKQAVGAR